MKSDETKNLFLKNLPDDFVFPAEAVGQKLLEEYGAVFVARGGAAPPKTVIFADETAVSKFQSSVPKSKETIGGFEIELQTAALASLKKAVREAEEKNLNITPRGADSARRNYQMTVDLWASRVDPALAHWTEKGRLAKAEAERIRALSPFEQTGEVFRLEESGLFFSKDLSKTIIYSVAPPGASQHLSMLALDVAEFSDARIRKILARHGWFQTVVSDLPHFTFLGVAETELSGLGLKKVENAGQIFWIPDI